MEFNYSLIMPELITVGVLLVVTLLAFSDRLRPQTVATATTAGLLLVAVLIFLGLDRQGELFGGLYVVDGFSNYMKLIFVAAAALISASSVRYVAKVIGNAGEFYFLVLAATLGMELLASAADFLTLYVALELMTISFVVLVAAKKGDKFSVEAGIKYVIFAGASSAVLLYGMSFLYGFTGTVDLRELAAIIQVRGLSPLSPAVTLGTILVLAGFWFKVSVVPFHMWAPDVYEGAPTPVTAFLAVGSKAAAFAILIRFFYYSLGPVQEQLVLLFAVLAVLTMVAGNLAALPQTNVKRLLAYSSIAQAGYILVGFLAADAAGGIKAMLFYLAVYLFATVGAFAVVYNYSNEIDSDEIKDYAGLAQRSPLMAGVLTISLLSLAGIPPLAGFVGKVYLFIGIMQEFPVVVFIGLIMSVVSVYYYLKIVLVMFRNEPPVREGVAIAPATYVVLMTCLVITIFLGVWAGPLSQLAGNALLSIR